MSSYKNPNDDRPETDESNPSRVFTRHKIGEAASKAGFGDVLVLSHESADTALTPTRREIIDTLSAHDVSSVRELADVVGRNPGNLSRDLKVLVAENIIRYVDDGSAKRPELKHDTIVVEPLVTSEDPLPESVSSV
jgi:predicted transcriptional regulator